MYGENPVTKKREGPGPFPIQDIFTTIQGEGPFSGERALFIRLAHCNLRCFWCDTEFESPRMTWEAGRLMREAVRRCSAEGIDLVVITGGEPLLYDLGPLVDLLARFIGRIQIESNGTLWWPFLGKWKAPKLTLVVSPKTSKVHPKIQNRADAFKYVMPDRMISAVDGLPLAHTQKVGFLSALARPPARLIDSGGVYIIPCDYGDSRRSEEARRRTAESALIHGWRAQVQLHKILELP